MLTALLVLSLAAAPATDGDAAAIKQLVSGFRTSVEKQDGKALSALFFPDAVIFLDGDEAKLETLPLSAKLKWTNEANAGRSEGPLAYVAQRAEIQVDGKKTAQTFTFVMRKREGVWKIAHLHWSRGR